MAERRLALLFGGQWIAQAERNAKESTSANARYLKLSRAAFKPESLHAVKGEDGVFDIVTGTRRANRAAREFPEGNIQVETRPLDAWQDVEMPHKNAYASRNHLVQVLHSNRPIRVSYKGELVAQSDAWFPLFEIGTKAYPVRMYIPTCDVRMELLTKTQLSTHCPFKGDASYYTIKPDGENLVWAYESPTETCALLKNTVCFYLEKEGLSYNLEGGEIEYPKEGFIFD